jgi:hypothetical protein
MKKQFNLLAITFLMLSVLAIPVALAQPHSGRGEGWRMEHHAQQMYDLDTIETIQGEVVEIDTVNPHGRRSGGVHLQVRTQTGEEIAVHLGPAWYIESQAVQIQVNDSIEVTGSRITFDGQPTLIAAEVRKGDQVLTLRDEDGIPVWADHNR